MIFDGRWKWELQKLSWSISVWRRFPSYSDFAEHQLNRAILYSATILRKVIEDETEAEEIAKKATILLPKQETLHTSLSAIKYPYIGEEGWAIRSKLYTSDYGIGQAVTIKAKDICNWLLHSYVRSIVYHSKQSGAKGFLVASDFDKEKCVHYISFEEWQKLLATAIENGTF